MSDGARSRSLGGPESIRRNAIFGFAVQITGAAFTAALTLFLVRALGPGEFGVFTLALGIGGLLLLPSDFGVTHSAARFIAERRDDRDAVGAVLSDALVLKLVGSTLVSAVLFAAAGPIASAYELPELTWPLRIVAVAVFGQSLMGLFQFTFVALGRTPLSFRLVLSESAVETGSSIGLVLLGAGVTGAALGRAIGFGLGAVVGATLVLALLGRGTIRIGPRPMWRLRRIAAYASALFVIDGAWALFNQIDVLLIGALLDSSAVGLYGAPSKVLAFAPYFGMALAAGVAPRLARHGNEPPNVGALATALRYLIIIHFAMVPPVVVWADPLVELLFGPDYGESAAVMRALAPDVFFTGLAALLALSVNYLGEARRRVPLAIGAVLINFVFDIVFIPKIGIVAGAIGTDIAIFVYFLGHLWIVTSLVELRIRPLLGTFLRSLLAALAMAAVLFAFGTSGISIVTLIFGGAAGIAAYCAAIVLVRELSPRELLGVRDALRSRAP